MDSGRLKRDTAVEHDWVESLVPLMQPGLTENLYRAVLVRFYGFIRGWEAWAEVNVPVELRPLLLERQRSHLLEADLIYFNEQQPKNLCMFSEISAPRKAAFLGAMYVIEGSTLGGQFIARHVEGALGLSLGHGDSYFRGYGERTGPMWRHFQQVLEEVSEDDAGVVIDAAKKMFSAFGEWMSHLEPVENFKIESLGVS